MSSERQQWLLTGGVGAVLFGTVFSLGVEAGYWKHSGDPIWLWMLGGTAGIALMITGIVLLIKAARLER
jgi:hypothetical protein